VPGPADEVADNVRCTAHTFRRTRAAIMDAMHDPTDLGAFLRSRRARVAPAELGLQDTGADGAARDGLERLRMVAGARA
jgi:hypothetical protein